jgi:hypothetical protein
MAKMKVLNAQKAERHRLSEADQAAFQQREQQIAAKRVEEQKATRYQDMERAKNRQRKLNAQDGREWDSEKQESDIVDRRSNSSQYTRGAHGGVARGRAEGLAASRYGGESEDIQDSSHSHRGREGRGGRIGHGARGGRGRGGGRSVATVPPVAQDFPTLPRKKAENGTDKIENGTPITDKPAGDWAEEMATPVGEKLAA